MSSLLPLFQSTWDISDGNSSSYLHTHTIGNYPPTTINTFLRFDTTRTLSHKTQTLRFKDSNFSLHLLVSWIYVQSTQKRRQIYCHIPSKYESVKSYRKQIISVKNLYIVDGGNFLNEFFIFNLFDMQIILSLSVYVPNDTRLCLQYNIQTSKHNYVCNIQLTCNPFMIQVLCYII